MTIQNLAIIFGPTLFGIQMSNGSNGPVNGGIADTAFQNKASGMAVHSPHSGAFTNGCNRL
jgi:hypothetical protein